MSFFRRFFPDDKNKPPATTLEDLIRFGTLTPAVAEFLRGCLLAGLNILIVGATDSGAQALADALAHWQTADNPVSVALNATPTDVLVRMQRLEDGSQKVLSVADATQGEPVDIFAFERSALENAKIMGRLRPTGFRPTFTDKLVDAGIQLPPGTSGASPPQSHDIDKKIDDGLIPPPAPPPPPIRGADYESEGDFYDDDDFYEDYLEEESVTPKPRRLQTIWEKLRGEILESSPPEFEGDYEEALPDWSGDEAKESAESPPPLESTPGTSIGADNQSGSNPPPQAVMPEPEPVGEDVQFSVFHPQEATAENWYTLLLYVHIADVMAKVRQDAQKFSDEMTDSVRAVTARKTTKLQRGTELRLVPQAEGVTFNPESLTVRWQEDYERARFRFQAATDLIGQPCFGELSVFVGMVEVATIRFSIFITDQAIPEAQATTTTATTQLYQRIFVSYSHKDTDIVVACKRAFEAIGYNVSIDYEDLRAGEVWSEALEHLIDEADIFQLFWSEFSSQSSHCRREWEYALHKKQASFIRPVYWQQPMPDIPDNLQHIHFKYLPEL